MNSEHTELLERVINHYFGSTDFNGLPVHPLVGTDNSVIPIVVDLVEAGYIDVVRGDDHPNPYIKAFPAEPNDIQVSKLNAHGLEGCLYPTEKVLLERYVDEDQVGPYTRELKLGAPQLDFRVFDLRILEWYRNDPRFYYEVDDIHGTIHQRPGSEGPDGGVLQDDLEYFQFGFAYNKDLDRAVAAFLRYLHDLPAEQQIHLAQYQLDGDFRLHPDFYRTQIIGDFPERVSIYDAFLEEKHIINEMCAKIGKPHLFRTQNTAYQRPPGFGMLIRPTRKEYRDFSLLLDQLLSDDINRDFFKGDIPIVETLTREDGSTINQSIGTITLLETWLHKNFTPQDKALLDTLFRNIRSVRSTRQKPAHKVDDNHFDQQYVKDQRELINKAFDAVRDIRMIFENHPKVRGYDIPDWLREGHVWTY